MRRAGLLSMAGLVVASIGLVMLARVAESDSSITVTQGHFTLTCPQNTLNEGQTLACTLANTSKERQRWPVVAILHLSTDDERALVYGKSIDVAFGKRSPRRPLDSGLEWVGPTLVGYSRFGWGGWAAAGDTRTVSIVAKTDAPEGGEAFYVALGPHRSRSVGLLYESRRKVTVFSANASTVRLSGLTLTAGGGG